MIIMNQRRGLLGLAAALPIALAIVVAPAMAAPPKAVEIGSTSFAVVAKITIKPGQTHRFIEAMKAQIHASREEPGVVDFRVFESSAKPLVFYSFEIYRTKAAFEAHLKTPATAKIMAVLKQVEARNIEAQFPRQIP